MSILDVTEEQIFHTLGKGKDPNFKPIEKVRPVMQPVIKKTYSPAVKAAVLPETLKFVPSPEVEESISKLTIEISELNKNVYGIRSMVKWYMIMFVLAIFLIAGIMGLFLL